MPAQKNPESAMITSANSGTFTKSQSRIAVINHSVRLHAIIIKTHFFGFACKPAHLAARKNTSLGLKDWKAPQSRSKIVCTNSNHRELGGIASPNDKIYEGVDTKQKQNRTQRTSCFNSTKNPKQKGTIPTSSRKSLDRRIQAFYDPVNVLR